MAKTASFDLSNDKSVELRAPLATKILEQLPQKLIVLIVSTTPKEIISNTNLYLVKLSSRTYVFEDKMTEY